MKQIVRAHRSPLSPAILFPVLWVAGALLSQLHLLNVQTGWSLTMTGVVAVVPVAFLVGTVAGSAIALKLGTNLSAVFTRPTERTLRTVLVAFVAIGYAELAHQFVKIGGIPLIAPDGNLIRFDQGGPTVILINLLTVAGLVAFARPRNPMSRESRFELAIVLLSLAGFLLQAGRGSLALMVVVGVAARWLYWGRPRAWLTFGAALVAFGILTFGFYLRTRHMPYLPFEAELFGELLPATPFLLKPFIPLYIAVTTNFYALQQIVAEFPDISSFGGGAYSAIGLDLFIRSARDITDVSSQISPPWITSTVAGSLWADGGFPAVMVGVALTGVLSGATFVAARRTRSLGWCLTAAYLLYVTVFGLYTNLWTQQVDWLMVAPLLIAVGSAAEPSSRGASRPATSDRVTSRTVGLMVATSLACLAIAAVAVERLLPKPLTPTRTIELPSSARSAATMMTDGDSTRDRFFWTIRKGSRLALKSWSPLEGGPARTELLTRAPHDSATFDVGRSVAGPSLALWQFSQRPDHLRLTVHAKHGRDRQFRVPLPAARDRTVRQLATATWSGPLPDLFVLDWPDANRKLHIRILSGESRFRKTLMNRSLPMKATEPENLSVDIGKVMLPEKSGRESRPDLMILRHRGSRDSAGIRLALGSRGFDSIAYRREVDWSGTAARDARYLIGHAPDGPTLDAIILHAGSVRLEQISLEEPRRVLE